MTGLNEIVWYLSWYWTLLSRGLLVAVVCAVVASLLLFEQTSFFVLLVIFVMWPLGAGLTVAWPGTFPRTPWRSPPSSTSPRRALA